MPVKFNEAPKITEMSVIPVAGKDSMLFNLSGAHSRGGYLGRMEYN